MRLRSVERFATATLLHTMSAALWVACAAILSGCNNEAASQSTAVAEPPGSKQAVRMLLSIHDIPLTTHPSCKDVGSEFRDKTIGDYIAGLMSDMGKTSMMGRNTVSAKCEPAGVPGAWRCTVELGRRDGENEWVRGVEFRVSTQGLVQRDSIRCTGGG